MYVCVCVLLLLFLRSAAHPDITVMVKHQVRYLLDVPLSILFHSDMTYYAFVKVLGTVLFLVLLYMILLYIYIFLSFFVVRSTHKGQLDNSIYKVYKSNETV